MSANEQIVEKFLIEAKELLEEIEEVLLELEANPTDSESVNRLFRAFHTIKGSGSMFGFQELAGFTHHLETLLDQIRAGKMSVDAEIISLCLESRDLISELLDNSADEERVSSMANRVKARLKVNETFDQVISEKDTEPKTRAIETWKIYFEPDVDLFTSGMNPVCLLDELRALGECSIKCSTKSLATFDDLNPEECHMSWDIVLTTDVGEHAIRDVFIFVETGATIKISKEKTDGNEQEPKGETIASGDKTPENKRNEDIPSDENQNASKLETADRSIVQKSTVRVTSDRLDKLVNLVGELVINRARLGQVTEKYADPDLDNVAESLGRLVDDLRDGVLGIRMTPIGSTFTRFKRLVRDLSAELDKKIDFITEGGETELDKTVLDRLTDPLLHLLRNALDHGIESTEIRELGEKPKHGTITLKAAHVGGSVQILLQDDGRGLDRDVILKKAINRGIIKQEADPSDDEIFSFIFAPGFSTASTVSSVSGRGVGMDVVKRTLESLRGSIEIDSKQGEGTTFIITLPLTLAIIEGMLVEVDKTTYILPMSSVKENVELSEKDKQKCQIRGTLAVRGELVPFTRLRDLFNIPGNAPSYETVVVTNTDSGRVGFTVDRVLGNHQTVIQPLGRFYEDLEIVSGSTVLGDGCVALILDPSGIVREAHKSKNLIKHQNRKNN